MTSLVLKPEKLGLLYLYIMIKIFGAGFQGSLAGSEFDDEAPIETTLRTIDDLVSERKVHYVGISACDAWKLTKVSGRPI